MTMLAHLYCHSLALLTDLYQLTMAYGYWKAGVADKEAVFHHFFREAPFSGGYALTCGVATAAEFLSALKFSSQDLDYLASLQGSDGRPLLEDDFLAHLGEIRFCLDVDAMREGTVAFANEPLVRVRGPILQCQIVETPLLNMINFQTLIATKAARVVSAAGDDPVLEFGLRRAQGIDGALAAARAAYVGGCAATSNVLAGKLFGIPVKGTHAHSWVMFFADETEAFRRFVGAMPNNSVLLVDTYDTLQGVRNAARIAGELRGRGYELGGIRLDSGDLEQLSKQARVLLDQAGFDSVPIVASNELDENSIAALKAHRAPIAVWGVGTKLVTAFDHPALSGVYKLSAVREEKGWRYTIKITEETSKVSIPGIQQVRRYFSGDEAVADRIYDTAAGVSDDPVLYSVYTGDAHAVPDHSESEDLLQPLFRGGELVGNLPGVREARERAMRDLRRFSPGIRRLAKPAPYLVGLDSRLHRLRQEAIARTTSRRNGD